MGKSPLAAALAALLVSSASMAADMSPEGRAALSIGGPWQTSESEHFIYHFSDAKLAHTVLAHSETYYGWLKELFGVSEDAWTRKVRVFVFHDAGEWDSFLARVGPGRHYSGFTTGWELFLFRDPSVLAPQFTLAHELTHVIAFRFLDGPIPLFLNEGLANYIGYKAAAQKADGDEYRFHTVDLLKPERFVPLDALAATSRYPEDAEAFYLESELFVRFLISKHKSGDFYALLKALSRGDSLESALRSHYGLEIRDVSAAFERYATTGK